MKSGIYARGKMAFNHTLERIMRLPLMVYVSVTGILILSGGCEKNKTSARFNVSADTAAVGETIYFTNNSLNAIYYQWTFGDGGAAVTKDASHVYQAPGTYTVTLTAIGKYDQSSTSKEIRITGVTSIFEGIGLSEISLGEKWIVVKNKMSTQDTTYSVSQIFGYYYHYITYENSGIITLFINTNPSGIDDDDEIYLIAVVKPYSGCTAKGIMLGDDISTVKTAYGTPNIHRGSNYYLYYYDELGIQFYTSLTSSEIDEIDIYYPGSGKGFTKAPSI
jgi:PKD repeat protein